VASKYSRFNTLQSFVQVSVLRCKRPSRKRVSHMLHARDKPHVKADSKALEAPSAADPCCILSDGVVETELIPFHSGCGCA